MPIYWMKSADVDPDAGFDEMHFIAFDPEVRFPRFDPEVGDEPIGTVYRVRAGPKVSQWSWSMFVALPGPAYGSATNGTEETRGAASRKVIEVYRHYLSTRPEQYPRV